MYRRAQLAFLVLALGLPCLADEITLTSGKVLTDVKVKKKSDGRWQLVPSEGRSFWIDAAEVKRHVERPTTAEVFRAKTKILKGKGDADALLELAEWGLERGLERLPKKILHEVIALDAGHARARALLGHVLCEDGEWRHGSKLETYRKQLEEKRLEERGWREVRGKWVDPYTARCLERGLVEHEGSWRTRKDVDRLRNGQFWLEGRWYKKSARKKTDAGLRYVGGRWARIETLDERHRTAEDPWVIESEHFLVRAPLAHKTITRVLSKLERQFDALRDFFEDGPVMTRAEEKISIEIVKGREAYVEALNAMEKDSRTFAYGDSIGAVYDPKGARVVTYYYSPEYLVQWCRHAVTHAYICRLAPYEKLPSNGYEALGAYFEGFADGTYHPSVSIWETGLRSWEKADPLEPIYGFTINPAAKSALDCERDFARMGFAMHFVRSTRPELMSRWVRGFLAGRRNHVHLVYAMLGRELPDGYGDGGGQDGGDRGGDDEGKRRGERERRAAEEKERKARLAAREKDGAEEPPDGGEQGGGEGLAHEALKQEFNAFLTAFRSSWRRPAF